MVEAGRRGPAVTSAKFFPANPCGCWSPRAAWIRGTSSRANCSAETLLHIVIAQETNAGVILHTHSIWNTLASLSEKDGGYAISHFEMLKGLQGIRTHEHTEVIPVLQNSQEMNSLGEELRKILRDESNPHGVLLKGHGLYTWGRDIFEARRHLEVLEFLFEVSVRARSLEQ